jgi:hypothetical protein
MPAVRKRLAWLQSPCTLCRKTIHLLDLIGEPKRRYSRAGQWCEGVVHVEHCSQASNCGRTYLLLFAVSTDMSVVVWNKMQPRYEKDRPETADVIYKTSTDPRAFDVQQRVRVEIPLT